MEGTNLMFNDRGNLIGLIFLLLCAVVGGVLVWSIVTGKRLEYNGPAWLTWVLGALFIGGIVYGMVQGGMGRVRSGGGPQWPNPASGRRPWWMFWKRQ
jgi:hypothetical protein